MTSAELIIEAARNRTPEQKRARIAAILALVERKTLEYEEKAKRSEMKPEDWNRAYTI